MKVILDTNILISSLCVRGGVTDAIYGAWLEKAYTMLTCEEQLDELRECFSRPSLVPGRIRRHEAGRLFNYVRSHAVSIESLPSILRSPDPDDNFLLAMAQAGEADYLVSGDKVGLLPLGKHRGTQILSPRGFADILRLKR